MKGRNLISLYDRLRIAYTAFICPMYTMEAYAYFNEEVKKQEVMARIIADAMPETDEKN